MEPDRAAISLLLFMVYRTKAVTAQILVLLCPKEKDKASRGLKKQNPVL